ncbi:MAG TPA: hypothetical protein VKA08_12955 [Balneolales bacterium]|nr:hypothetical protein [Balneolales bacterium]
MATEGKKRAAHSTVVTRVLEGDGMASPAQRRAAFDNKGLDGPIGTLVGKVATQPARVTDEDVAAVKASGISEDQIFELVICAAVGQSTRQYETALNALSEALADRTGGRHAT